MSKEICMTNEQREIHRKKRVLEHAERIGNVNKTCRYFGVARSTFYLWRARYRELGDEGLKSRRHHRSGPRLSPKLACRVDQKRGKLPYRASGKNVVLEKPTADTSMSATKRFNQE